MVSRHDTCTQSTDRSGATGGTRHGCDAVDIQRGTLAWDQVVRGCGLEGESGRILCIVIDADGITPLFADGFGRTYPWHRYSAT